MTTEQEDGSSPLEPVPMQAVPPPERRTRAGRNLPAAIGVGLALGAVVLLSLYVWKPAFVGVVVVAIVLAAWELTNAFGSGRIRVPVVPLAVGAAAIIVSAYAGGSEAMVVALALTVFAMMLWRSPENPKG
jgi:phosphatidate cytidylyltransferase